MIKQIPNFPDYWITDKAEVFSKKKYKTIRLSPGLATGGYHQVWLSVDGVKTGFRVNRLMLTVFVGPPPSPNHDAAHLDGNKLNNALTNLAWKTKKENAEDKERHGTKAEGETVGTSRWNVTQIKEMRRLHNEGLNNQEIADLYDTHRASVSRIVSGNSWRHV